jgi:hypothetical protein
VDRGPDSVAEDSQPSPSKQAMGHEPGHKVTNQCINAPVRREPGYIYTGSPDYAPVRHEPGYIYTGSPDYAPVRHIMHRFANCLLMPHLWAGSPHKPVREFIARFVNL